MDKRIGAQLYTLRDFCKTAEDLENTFKKLNKIGYKTVQLSAIGDIDPKTIKSLCDHYGLEPICTHRPMDDYIERLDWCIDFHKTIGCTIPGIGAMPDKYRTGADGFRSFIKELAPAADRLKAEGMSLAYHNHDFEFVKENGRFLMDIILEESCFDLILDVYWLAHAGINPADFIRKIGSRASVIHFKDLMVQPANAGVTMCEVMEGNLDWDSIISACEASGCGYAMVEQDICRRDPFESMEISYRNLTGKGFI